MRPCSAQPAILPKLEFMLDLTEEALKVLMYPQENILGGNFFRKNAGLESVPGNIFKTVSTAGILYHGFCKVSLNKISKKTLCEVSLSFLL